MSENKDLARYAKLCRNEYVAYKTYSILSRSRLVSARLRKVFEEVAKDEVAHYDFWRSLSGECASRVLDIIAWLNILLYFLYGATVTLKHLESGEEEAAGIYETLAKSHPELGDKIEKIIEEERTHEKMIADSVEEERVKYIGSITLGISDALVELTGIYTGSLGAFDSPLAAGLTGLLAGIAASISMGVASYAQARHEGRGRPGRAATYTSLAYLIVVSALAAPYFIAKSIQTAFASMVIIALLVVAYMSFYSSVLHGRNYMRELVLTAGLILGISTVLYILGKALGGLLGIAPPI